MKFSAAQIAQFLNGRVEGNPEAQVWTFSKIQEGAEGSLTFLANPKYTPYIYTTAATAVLVHRDFVAEEPVRATLIRVDDPYASLSVLLNIVSAQLYPQPTGIEEPHWCAGDVEIPQDAYIGAFSYIGKGTVLGRGVKIYPHVYIAPGCRIGEGSILYSGVKVYPGCVIGRDCVIHSGAVIGADGFGFAPDARGKYHKIAQIGIVEIGDGVEIGANATVDRATMGATRIGDGTKLDNLVQVAHNVTIGTDTVMAAQTGVAGSTSIGNNCMIGGQVGFAGHITVGDNVTIGAQSGIPGNVHSGARLMGYPAVDAGAFARTHVYIKRLGDLFARVGKLEKNNKQP